MNTETIGTILGWTGLVFYVGSLCFSNMERLRKCAFASTANDLTFAIMIGSLPILAINIAVGGTNLYRLLEDKYVRATYVLKYTLGILISGIAIYAAYRFYVNPTWTETVGWTNTALVILAFSLKDRVAMRSAFIASAVVGFSYAFMIDQVSLMTTKLLIGIVSTYHLIKE